jgi:molybdate transport system substrate-binding protein
VDLQKLFYFFCLCAVLFFSGCKIQSLDDVNKNELLIYCGTTMLQAVREIADIFEQRENCIVKIINDGSGNLYRSIHINQVGDLYLPGSESYMDKCRMEGTVVEFKPVGFNRAVFLVAKGNPLNIGTNLNNFTNGKYRTVLGASESGSIGRETRNILKTAGLYTKAVEQALFMVTDSKDIEKAIKENRADLTINWHAASLQDGNSAVVDVLSLDNSIAFHHALILGVLKTAHYPELARRFMALASSMEGQSIFLRYGFGK